MNHFTPRPIYLPPNALIYAGTNIFAKCTNLAPRPISFVKALAKCIILPPHLFVFRQSIISPPGLYNFCELHYFTSNENKGNFYLDTPPPAIFCAKKLPYPLLKRFWEYSRYTVLRLILVKMGRIWSYRLRDRH